jgi:peptide/nickel transport system substrate-binding protein
MENRFGLKDLIVVVLLVGVIITILLAMKQFDRQYEVMQRMEGNLRNQAEQVAELNRTLARGISLGGATTQMSAGGIESSPKGNPFKAVEEVQAKPDFARGDWLVENFGVKFQRLTPLGTVGDLYSTIVQSRIWEPLVYRDPVTLEYLPLLARDWQIKDHSAEYNAYAKPLLAKGVKPDDIANDPKAPTAIEVVFQLRKGVTFSDGHPFNADDVVFTFNWIMNKDVEAPRERAYFARVKSVEKINDYEVVFKFKEPYFEAFAVAGTMDIMPRHFYEQYTPQKFNQTPGLMMGTGPYMLRDPQNWTPGQKVELVRNERYWGVRGTFDRIVYNEVEGETAEIAMLRNGQLDRLACSPDEYVELLKDSTLQERDQHIAVSALDSGYTFIGWNQERGGKKTFFADKRVRQALTMLSDRERMAKELWRGYATVAKGTFSAQSRQSDPNTKPLPFDPERAKALLKEAGFYDRDGDGVIESPDGRPFRFKLSYNAKNEFSNKIALFLKDGYARAGIAMEPDPTDWTIMMKNMDSRNFDAVTMGWTSSVESDLSQIFHSDQIKDAGDNFIHYSSPELDKLIEEARSTVDEAKRMPIWQHCDRIIGEDQPYTFLLERQSLYFIDKRIQNVGTSKLGLNYAQRYEMPIPWYVPTKMQRYK